MPENPEVQMASHKAVERAIDALRRQEGIIISEGDHAIANYPAEFLTETLLSEFRHSSLQLLVTAARARMIGMGAEPLRIRINELSLADIMALCDPLAAQKPPASISAVPASDIDRMALTLAKYAALLPALVIRETDQALHNGWPCLTADDLRHYIEAPLVDVTPTAQALLPIEHAENASIISFRSCHSTAVHLALVIGNIHSGTPLTRIHSSCFTGDILGSLRCDCGDQLKLALAEITKAGAGILIYLHQEGRGIGITNKLRAYQLQQRGVDTYDANLMLGFDEDERDFRIAAAMLKKLGVTRIRMLTNNPHKMTALEQAGITIAERLPLIAPTGRHNHVYLEAKATKSGHIF